MSEDEAKQNEDDDPFDQAVAINNASSKGVLSDLLGPTARALGDYFGERTEAFVRRKRDENLRKHIAEVHDATSARIDDITPRIATDLSDWAKGAQDVDDDDEKAALWRGILEGIIEGNERGDRLIEIAKSLSYDELEVLMSLNLPEKIVDRGSARELCVRRLSTKGLINSQLVLNPVVKQGAQNAILTTVGGILVFLLTQIIEGASGTNFFGLLALPPLLLIFFAVFQSKGIWSSWLSSDGQLQIYEVTGFSAEGRDIQYAMLKYGNR